MITIDNDRKQVIEESLKFIQTYTDKIDEKSNENFTTENIQLSKVI